MLRWKEGCLHLQHPTPVSQRLGTHMYVHTWRSSATAFASRSSCCCMAFASCCSCCRDAASTRLSAPPSECPPPPHCVADGVCRQQGLTKGNAQGTCGCSGEGGPLAPCVSPAQGCWQPPQDGAQSLADSLPSVTRGPRTWQAPVTCQQTPPAPLQSRQHQQQMMQAPHS